MDLEKALLIAFSWWPRVAIGAGVVLAGVVACTLI